MRVFAIYLPQFHRIPENDAWWGDGFTEWTAVKNAVPLYDGHDQPRIPYNENYYDLLDKSTMKWQASLMNRYGIDGICMYHYWFKDGRRVLERPEQNLLAWTDIRLQFCFSWANESWARTWSNIESANSWSDLFDKSKKGECDGLLLEQEYGNEQHWREHFEYLLPFFKDDRYIKLDNKPIFMIYKTKDMDCFVDMSVCWNKLARKAGFDGVYFICGRTTDNQKEYVNAELYHVPTCPILDAKLTPHGHKGLLKISYESLWNQILLKSSTTHMYYSGLVGFDNTPRMGEKRGQIIEGGSPEKFGYYMSKLMKKAKENGDDIVFVHAWNEWGEGMYLEPDVTHGYKYLEALKCAKDNYNKENSFLPPDSDVCVLIEKERGEKEKIQYNLETMLLWKDLANAGYTLENILKEQNAHNVCIYGWGVIGKHIYNDLLDSSIEISGIIDIGANDTDVCIYRPDNIPNADMVIVSVAVDGEVIKKSLEIHYNLRVCTFKELLLDKFMQL